MKKLALAAICFAACLAGPASGLLTQAAQAQVVIRVAPPAPIVETYGPRPHPGYVWVGGYHRWDGARYVWTQGYWAAPPRPHAVWIRGHYVRRGGGWIFVEGRWR